MKILLVGRNGQVGWELERLLRPIGELIATDRATLNLADNDAICRTIREAGPELIVNAAAYTAVDKAEAEQPLARQINAVAPGVMAEEAKRLGARLVHFSTDYVFDGAKSSPYTERDSPNPLNAYGVTKLEGDERIRLSGCRHLIVRTSWLYGPRGKNFYLTIARKAAASERLRVVNDQRGVPTSSRFLAEKTIALIGREVAGLVNVVASGEATWLQFAREIVRVTGSASDVEPVASDQFPTAARRPRYSVLDKTTAENALAEVLPDWQTHLSSMSRPGIWK